MKYIFVIAFAFSIIPLSAQTETFPQAGDSVFIPRDSIAHMFGLPLIDPDSAQAVPRDHDPPDALVRIPNSDLPRKLVKTLRKDALFEGWEKAPVYRQKNTGIYIIRFSDRNTTRTYGFTEHGQIVTFRETNRPVQ